MVSELKKMTIIVIDDESGALELTKYWVKRGGHEVLVATSAEAAIDLVGNFAGVDLVIVDQVMPRMKGLDLIKKLRDDGNLVPIWLVSGQLTEHIKTLAVEYGANKVVSKTDLVAALQEEKILP